MTARLSIYLLGPIEVNLDGQPLSGFEYNKVRALLAFLAVEAAQPHPRVSLCNLLWPDLQESAARQNLSQALTQLRKVLRDKSAETPFLQTTTENVQLNPAATWEVDTTQFNALVAAAESHAHRSWKLCSPCAANLRLAAGLYRGDFLAQFYLSDSAPFEEWALLLRERLRQRMLSVLERLAQYAEWHEAYEQAIEIARRQAEMEPLSDESQRELMRLLALDGQKAAALAQYEILRRTLMTELNLEPEPETTALFEKIRHAAQPEALRRFQSPASRLPAPPTELIGRSTDLARVTELLGDGARLVTIIGAPGVGKTRLALEAAYQLRYDFEEGACFVELAPVVEAVQVPAALAQALGVKEEPGRTLEQTLQAYLKPRNILLVLDNFEHVSEAALFVAGLLSSDPAVRLLVTSRVALRLRAEQQYPLRPLSYEEAIQLFTRRAQAVQPGFRLSTENREAVAAICRRLDNLPLGIELVAVRITNFSTAGLLQQLKRRLEIPTGGARDLPKRQGSLREAIAWSYHRLAGDEQRLFAYLGSFAGGCTAEAALAVASAAGADFVRPVPELLKALVENNLVQTQIMAGETRFNLLETIREFALGQLEAQGETEAVRRRHTEYFTGLAELTRGRIANEWQNEWYARLNADIDNLRTALRWASDHNDHQTMLRISVPLYHFWWHRGLGSEGLLWLEMALPYRAVVALNLQAEALINAGVLAYQQDYYPKAKSYLQDGLQAARQADHKRLTRGALANLGNLALTQGEFDQVEDYLREAIAVSRAINDESYTRFTLTVLADLQYRQGQYADSFNSYARAMQVNQKYNDQEGVADSLWGLARASRGLGKFQQAVQYSLEAMTVYRQMDHELGVGWVKNVQADIARDQGKLDEAAALYHEALDIRLKHDDKQGCSRVLDEAASALVRLHHWTESVLIMGAADAARLAMRGHMTDYERRSRDRALEICRAALGKVACQAAWDAGQVLTLPQAVALV